MPVFDKRFYQLGVGSRLDTEGYRAALLSTLDQCASLAERNRLLRQEAIEIARHITDGICDLIKYDGRKTL